MYVRWKRRPLARRKVVKKDQWLDGDYLLAASLVENRRVDGKPRQRTICYLGSIREAYLPLASPRSWFFVDAEARMVRASIPEMDRPRYLAALEERVPRPTTEEANAEASAHPFSERRIYSWMDEQRLDAMALQWANNQETTGA